MGLAIGFGVVGAGVIGARVVGAGRVGRGVASGVVFAAKVQGALGSIKSRRF